MAAIVVNSLSNVTVDGTPAGSVTDVLTNFKSVAGIRGEVLRATRAWATARDYAHAAALATLRAKLVADLAAKDERIDKLQARIDALGGTELARRLARAERRKALAEQQAAAAAELAKLDAEEAAPPQPE